MGRQKIEIKKIENEDARLVSFSKRRTGLFNKASCLSTLCGADVAVVVFSPAGTPYSFGSPRVDQVLTRFLSGGKEPVEPAIMRQNHVAAVQELSRQCMELESRVEAFQTKRRNWRSVSGRLHRFEMSRTEWVWRSCRGSWTRCGGSRR
ncbi:hypothetical protein HPP92_018777 [Vanilla planifolia]|uniref:MADS-box domain-containing protein n=1 Tax=Vanilla planifolia TaxID=51239 RepID=A0A835UMK5_VANPL|nr:hypothetical protein HPP92_018777 [Vanilla planifolia]